MRKAYVIHSIAGFKDWEACFRFVMEQSDSFRIIFQNDSTSLDEGGLNGGKRAFLSLPSLTITPYKGMENSIEVSGELTGVARETFLTFMAPSFDGNKSDLWSFQFLQRVDVLLRVEDFTVCLLFLNESEVDALVALGIERASLEEIESELVGEHQSDSTVVRWSKDELSDLSNIIQATWSASNKNAADEVDK